MSLRDAIEMGYQSMQSSPEFLLRQKVTGGGHESLPYATVVARLYGHEDQQVDEVVLSPERVPVVLELALAPRLTHKDWDRDPAEEMSPTKVAFRQTDLRHVLLTPGGGSLLLLRYEQDSPSRRT